MWRNRPNSICLNNLPTDINSVIQQIEEEGRELDGKELGVKSTPDLNNINHNNINNNNNSNSTKTRMRLRSVEYGSG